MAPSSRWFALSAVVLLISCCAPRQAASETTLVTCGSVIKLQHQNTGYLLHSHEIAYGSGSGQQSVTGDLAGEDAASYWVVRPVVDATCRQGTPIKDSDQIRLQHSTTRKWLHSHHFPSPLTNQQEVSCFGDDQHSDTGDSWSVHLEGGKHWTRNAMVRLKHEDTGMWLSSSAKRYGRPIAGQQEVCGRSKNDKNGLWLATEGVFFPPRSDS